jgi:hypothetical protein
MWQALEPNPNDYVDAETIAHEARNVQGIPLWLAQVEAKSGYQKSMPRVALLSTSARPSGSEFGNQRR